MKPSARELVAPAYEPSLIRRRGCLRYHTLLRESKQFLRSFAPVCSGRHATFGFAAGNDDGNIAK